jgi:hypothetical protein
MTEDAGLVRAETTEGRRVEAVEDREGRTEARVENDDWISSMTAVFTSAPASAPDLPVRSAMSESTGAVKATAATSALSIAASRAWFTR